MDRQENAYTLTYGPLAEASDGEVVFPPLTSITDEAGQTVTVASTADGRITSFTHPDGRVWTLGYDASGNLTSIKDGAGRTRSFDYNAAGLLSVVTGADGVDEITNAYDEVNRVVTQTDGAGNVRTIAYAADHSTTLTDALGNVSMVDHNAKGQAVASHDAAGGVTLTGYDANYNPTSRRRQRQRVPLHVRLVRVGCRPAPCRWRVTTYTYNSVGDLTSITTPDGNGGSATTSFVLNADGRAIETHLPGRRGHVCDVRRARRCHVNDGRARKRHHFRVRRARERHRGDGRPGRHHHNAFDLANRVYARSRPAAATPPSLDVGRGGQPHERHGRPGPGHEVRRTT